MISKKALLQALRFTPLITLAVLASPANSADAAYPSKPIKIVVPFGAGGAVDFAARLLGKQISERLGQQVIVENKPGAGGLIAVRHVISSPADGYTLLLSAAGEITINPVLNKEAGYDPEKDLTPVSTIVRAPNVLVINADFPAANIKELIEYGRKHPGELTYSSSGVGTIQHITGAVFNQVANVEARHVPYSGAPQATMDVATKRVSMTFASPASIKPFVKRGELKMLGVVMSERYPLLPELPTIKETAGMESYDVESWFALFAPAGTPEPIVKKINEEIQRAMRMPDIAAKLVETAGMPTLSSVEETKQFIRREIVKYKEILKTSHITLQ